MKTPSRFKTLLPHTRFLGLPFHGCWAACARWGCSGNRERSGGGETGARLLQGRASSAVGSQGTCPRTACLGLGHASAGSISSKEGAGGTCTALLASLRAAQAAARPLASSPGTTMSSRIPLQTRATHNRPAQTQGPPLRHHQYRHFSAPADSFKCPIQSARKVLSG